MTKCKWLVMELLKRAGERGGEREREGGHPERTDNEFKIVTQFEWYKFITLMCMQMRRSRNIWTSNTKKIRGTIHFDILFAIVLGLWLDKWLNSFTKFVWDSFRDASVIFLSLGILIGLWSKDCGIYEDHFDARFLNS